jgi:ABC-type nitrate/sulfonate/bicarbonate transport system substrate-binding protein
MKSSQSSVLLNAIAFLVALGLLVSPSLSLAADKSRKLRLAYSGWEIGTAVSYVGVDSGLFKKHDVDIEELPIRDTL